MKKCKDLIIARDTAWYNTFPSLTRTRNGELLCGFRHAPWEEHRSHLHSHSRAVFVRSSDDGVTWSGQPEPLCAEDELGQQDPQLATLSDGRVVGSFFRWQAHPLMERSTLPDFQIKEKKDCLWSNVGVALTWSRDAGRTWSELHRVPSPWGARGGASRAPVVETTNGALLLPCYGSPKAGEKAVAYLMKSDDGGVAWSLFSIMADGRFSDEPYDCHEPYVQRMESDRLVCFIRCYGDGGRMRMCSSNDDGKTWSEPVETNVWGFPQAALRLDDGRIVLAYGYRRPPYGVRARIVLPDLSNVDDGDELIVRDDGDDRDLGYPSLVARKDGTILIAYYIHRGDGIRHIAATIVDLGL